MKNFKGIIMSEYTSQLTNNNNNNNNNIFGLNTSI